MLKKDLTAAYNFIPMTAKEMDTARAEAKYAVTGNGPFWWNPTPSE